MDHLMGTDELCSRLGITRDQLARMFMSSGDVTDLFKISSQRLDQLIEEGDFPEPVAQPKAGKIYLTGDIREYAQRKNRPLPGQGT